MSKPVRLQLSRRKGFNLQRVSREANGLRAVNVARPFKWGNPYKARGTRCAKDAVKAYRTHILVDISLNTALGELRGKNLACWCKPGAPCHADALLELANA